LEIKKDSRYRQKRSKRQSKRKIRSCTKTQTRRTAKELPIEMIAKITGLSVKKVKQLQ